MINAIKEKCTKELINYGNTKITERIMKLINNKFSQIIKDNLIGLELNEKHNIYVINDIITGKDNYKYFLLNKAETIFSDSEQFLEFIFPLIDFIKNMANKDKNGAEKFTAFLNFL